MTARLIVAYSLMAAIALGFLAAMLWARYTSRKRRQDKVRLSEDREYLEMIRRQDAAKLTGKANADAS